MAKPEPLFFTIWKGTQEIARFEREAKADDLKLFTSLMVETLKAKRWDKRRWNEFQMDVRDRDRRRMATIRVTDKDA